MAVACFYECTLFTGLHLLMFKRVTRRLLSSAPLLRAWQVPGGTLLSLFTLHRFAVPDLGVPGHDSAKLTQTLARLRRHQIPILTLREVLEAVREQRPLPRHAAVFTVDDGYFDFGEVGASIFAAYDCPVTIFLVTGFLDGTCWLWWDRIRHIFTNGDLRAISAGLPAGEEPFDGIRDRVALAAAVSTAMTRIPHAEVGPLTSYLAERAGVCLPEHPPEADRPMTWDTVRALQSEIVSFGPHTVTHPILPRTSRDTAEREIHDSWRRLQETVPDPLPVFAYPNGDHGVREIELVRSAGLHGAVSTVPAYLTPAEGPTDTALAFQMPRFAYPDQPESLLLTAAGFRRIQQALRSRGTQPRAVS